MKKVILKKMIKKIRSNTTDTKNKRSFKVAQDKNMMIDTRKIR